MKGFLVIVGTGIRLIKHTTTEARITIENAEKVLFLLADPVAEIWIKRLNPSAESLFDCYVHGEPRNHSYEKMVVLHFQM
jgi:hypothetical protein